MRILTLLLLAAVLLGCASAGVTIPAQQTFILGEYKETGYTATLANDGKTTVRAQLVNKQSEVVSKEITIEPGTAQKVKVGADQRVHLVNANDRKALVNVRAKVAGVEGMRYVDNDPTATPETIELREGQTVAIMNAPAEGSSATTASLEPGQMLIIGEGSDGGYRVDIRNRGGDLKVAARDRQSKKQTQGFGLGRRGSETIYLRPGEELCLTNVSKRSTKVSTKTEKPVRGVRVTEAER